MGIERPRRRPYSRGHLPDLDRESVREMALREFGRDFYVASLIKPHLSRVKFVRSTLQKWGEDFPPISVRREV
eukprot:3326616-Amphidinium_carterae.1